MLRNVLGRIGALPVAAKVLLGVAALIALGLAVVLSPLLLALSGFVLIVAVIALFVQLLRRGSLRRWGIVAAASLVLVLVFSGISNALYFGGEEEEAASPERTQQTELAPPEETITAAEPTTSEAEGAAGKPGEKEDGLGRYDAVATVTEVVDGDTIEISPAIEGKEEVRLIGVDTPETKDRDEGVEPYGEEASNYAVTELEGEEIELEFDVERTDQYGRLLAYVYPMGEEMFNEDLLDGGYAQFYTVSSNDRYENRLQAAQEEARDAELGIWGLSHDEQCELADRGNGIGEGSPGCVEAQKPPPKPQPKPRPVPASPTDLDCSNFDSQLEAQAALEADSSDPNGLDADGDGRACEESSFGGSSAGSSAQPNASASASAAPSGGGGEGGGAPASVPSGGDINCDEVDGPIRVPPGDPYTLDGDGDGWGCE